MTNPTECFIIAQPRSDGTIPNAVKAWHDQIFWTEEDAEQMAKVLRERMYPGMQAFRCLIDVVGQVGEKE